MKLRLLTSLIWITGAIATPISVLPSAPSDQKNERKESVDHYSLPSGIRPYVIPFDAETLDERKAGTESAQSPNQEETDGELEGRELPGQEFHQHQQQLRVNGSTVKETFGSSRSLPRVELHPEESAEYFGKRMTGNVRWKNAGNSSTTSSGYDSQDGIVLMNFKGSQKSLNNSDVSDGRAGNVSATRNVSESLENVEKNTQSAGDYYDGQGDESVLSEVIKSYEEIRAPFEEIQNRAVNGTVFEQAEKNVREEKLQTGIFSRPIVVLEENYRTSGNDSVDSNQKKTVFGEKTSALANDRKGIMSSSTILSPLQVGIALMNQIPEDKPRKEESKYSDNPIEESKQELLLSDEPNPEKMPEPSKKSEGTVEIQKSVELYHNAPIQEIHYPVEYTSHIYTVPQMDQTRSNLLRNEIETLKSTDEQNAEVPGRFVPEEESLGFQYTLNGVNPEESELSIVPQPTIYVQSIQEQQNSLQGYGERKRLAQVAPEEYLTSGNESGKMNNENPAATNQPLYALYQFPNLQILLDKAKEIEKDSREENKNTVQQYVVEYQKSVEPQEYVSQQVLNYQPVESQQVLYGASEGQRNVYQPVDNRQNVQQAPEIQENIYQSSDNQQNVYQPPENQQSVYQSSDNQQNIYQPAENQQIIYQGPDNQQNIYQSPENQRIVYQATNNQQNIYQPAESQQNLYQSVENQQNIYQPPGNPATIYPPVKYNPERTRPQSDNNPPPERYPNEKYVHKGPQVPYQDLSYPVRQSVPRQESFDHHYAIPLRLPFNPSVHKHVIVPVTQILPYSIQRFMVQPPVVPGRPLQPYYANKIEVIGSRDSPRQKPRPRPVVGSEKTSKYKSPVTKIPERTSNLQSTNRHSPAAANHRQNVSNVLQLYDYVYDTPVFAISKERGTPKNREQSKKQPQTALQYDEGEPRQTVPRFSFSVRPPSPQVALNFHAGSRKRQALYGASKNRSAKDASGEAGLFHRPNPTGSLKVTRQLEGRNSIGSFRQSKMEYGFKPPMVPSVQYDEETATKVES